MRAAARQQLGSYGRLPFYAGMFSDAGFRVSPDGTMPDALFDELVVSGTPAEVENRLLAIQEAGVDELVVAQVSVADAAAEASALVDLLARAATRQ